MMTDNRLPVSARQTGVMDIDELKTLLASSGAFTFNGHSREETYAWIERLVKLKFLGLKQRNLCWDGK